MMRADDFLMLRSSQEETTSGEERQSTKHKIQKLGLGLTHNCAPFNDSQSVTRICRPTMRVGYWLVTGDGTQGVRVARFANSTTDWFKFKACV